MDNSSANTANRAKRVVYTNITEFPDSERDYIALLYIRVSNVHGLADLANDHKEARKWNINRRFTPDEIRLVIQDIKEKEREMKEKAKAEEEEKKEEEKQERKEEANKLKEEKKMIVDERSQRRQKREDNKTKEDIGKELDEGRD